MVWDPGRGEGVSVATIWVGLDQITFVPRMVKMPDFIAQYILSLTVKY